MSGENITVFSCLSILPLRSTSPGSFSRCQIFMPCMAGIGWLLQPRFTKCLHLKSRRSLTSTPGPHLVKAVLECPGYAVAPPFPMHTVLDKKSFCKRKNISKHYRVTIECKQKGQFHWDGRTQLYQVQTIKLMSTHDGLAKTLRSQEQDTANCPETWDFEQWESQINLAQAGPRIEWLLQWMSIQSNYVNLLNKHQHVLLHRSWAHC